MNIWSIRFSPSRGVYVVEERSCAAADADAWLRIFRQDEPGVRFVAARTKPRLNAPRARKAA